jgi:hypothetical protein
MLNKHRIRHLRGEESGESFGKKLGLKYPSVEVSQFEKGARRIMGTHAIALATLEHPDNISAEEWMYQQAREDLEEARREIAVRAGYSGGDK